MNLGMGSWVNQHGEPEVDTHALGLMCLLIFIDLFFLKEQLSPPMLNL
jgi:hypothetical protein